jgi:hypothetical protein
MLPLLPYLLVVFLWSPGREGLKAIKSQAPLSFTTGSPAKIKSLKKMTSDKTKQLGRELFLVCNHS